MPECKCGAVFVTAAALKQMSEEERNTFFKQLRKCKCNKEK